MSKVNISSGGGFYANFYGYIYIGRLCSTSYWHISQSSLWCNTHTKWWKKIDKYVCKYKSSTVTINNNSRGGFPCKSQWTHRHWTTLFRFIAMNFVFLWWQFLSATSTKYEITSLLCEHELNSPLFNMRLFSEGFDTLELHSVMQPCLLMTNPRY